MSKETRDRIAFRMQPETRRRIEQWYAADNCQSKNEFIEKAVNFYVDYLGIQDNTTLLPMAIMSAIDGRLSRLEDYIARRDFTRCVEQDMTNGIIAEAFEMDRDDLKRRRAQTSAERPECEGHKRYHLSGEIRTLPSGAGLG